MTKPDDNLPDNARPANPTFADMLRAIREDRETAEREERGRVDHERLETLWREARDDRNRSRGWSAAKAMLWAALGGVLAAALPSGWLISLLSLWKRLWAAP